MVAVGQVIKKGDGDLDRSVLSRNPILSARGDWVYPNNLEAVQLHEKDFKVTPIVDSTRPIDILFIGDSHVEQYSARVKKLSLSTGLNAAFITSGGCLTVPGIHGVDGGFKNCSKAISMIERALSDGHVKKVVVGNIWGNYKHQPTGLVFEHADGEKQNLDQGGFEAAIANLSKIIKDHGDKQFFVLLDYPWNDGTYSEKSHTWAEGTYNPSKHINRWSSEQIEHIYVPYPELGYWKEGNEIVQKILAGQVRFIETASLVCPNQQCDLIVYRDDDHLRSSYVEKHATWIDQVFE